MLECLEGVRNDKYEIRGFYDNIGEFIDGSAFPKYYKISNLTILGDSFAPPTEYQYTENVLNKIYNSGFFVRNYKHGTGSDHTNEHIINSVQTREIAKWIVYYTSNELVEQVDKLPNIEFEWEVGTTAYWHGEKININLYANGNTEYIEIINNGKKIIYKDNAVGSIGGLMGD